MLAHELMLAAYAQTGPEQPPANLVILPTARLLSGGTPPAIEQAMHAYHVAGDAWEACGEPERAAQARYQLARLWIHFSAGEGQSEALGRAVEVLESIATTWTRDKHPHQWGNVQAALGLALANRPGGLDADTLERAILHWEAALEMPIPPAPHAAFEKASRQHHLAMLYAQRYTDDRVTDIENALALFQDALRVRTRESFPQEWADTQNSLANAWQQRLRDDPAQNMERAIRAYRAALEVWTRDRDPDSWAMIQRNLAEAYRQRVLGQPEENQERAIEHFRAALTVYTREDHPIQWASVCNSLANLYCSQLGAKRAGDIQTGIRYYEKALQVYTRGAYPRQWAQTVNNLANAYCVGVAVDPADRLWAAIDLYQQALRVRTRDEYPREWAATHNNVGTAYADLGQWEQAADHFQKALEIRSVHALPDKALQTARNLGALHFGGGRWPEAVDAYHIARQASDTLYLQAITEVGKRAEIGRGGGVTHNIAYALAQMGDLREAVLELERGRARLLAEALARDRAVLDHAPEEDRVRYETAVDHIRTLEAQLRAAELHARGAADAPTTARPFLEIANDLSSARVKLNQAVAAIRRGPDYEDPLARPEFDDVQQAVRPDVPLAYLVATSAGGLALVVRDDGVQQVPLPDLTEPALVTRVQRWFGIYLTYLDARRAYAGAEQGKKGDLEGLRSRVIAARRRWRAVLKDTTRWLWGVLMESLMITLGGDCRYLTLIPTGLLGLLPLHAAWRPGDGGASPRYALDDVALSYAPSARALVHARRVADDVGESCLFIVNNPDGSLRHAADEAKAVKSHFSTSREVAGCDANQATVLQALASSEHDVFHFACHGSNNWHSPLESALWMYDGAPLSVSDLLGVKQQSRARLAFLSACETGLIGTQLPDEVVGLAAGFTQAGAAGVISTLWSVDDESTALLAGRFYAHWKEGRLSPPEALAAAQRWLRDEAGMERWRHPYYWAAFTMTGV